MEMTQTPLFPSSYVNLVNKKDHWKIGESEHNTDCDVKVNTVKQPIRAELNIIIHDPSK